MKTNQVKAFWACMDQQRWDDLPGFFAPAATIFWPNTNEKFTVQDFVSANKHYPGRWHIAIERIEQTPSTIITVVKVSLAQGDASFHATSFFDFAAGEEKIVRLHEYWGDDGAPPAWRTAMHIGSSIE